MLCNDPLPDCGGLLYAGSLQPSHAMLNDCVNNFVSVDTEQNRIIQITSDSSGNVLVSSPRQFFLYQFSEVDGWLCMFESPVLAWRVEDFKFAPGTGDRPASSPWGLNSQRELSGNSSATGHIERVALGNSSLVAVNSGSLVRLWSCLETGSEIGKNLYRH